MRFSKCPAENIFLSNTEALCLCELYDLNANNTLHQLNHKTIGRFV